MGLDSRFMQSLHQYVLSHLADTKGDWPTVAKASGVPYRTLKKIAGGLIVSPGVRSIEKLADYFRASDQQSTVN